MTDQNRDNAEQKTQLSTEEKLDAIDDVVRFSCTNKVVLNKQALLSLRPGAGSICCDTLSICSSNDLSIPS